MKGTEKIVNELNNLEPISYDNGSGNDVIHVGQILAQYIRNEVGYKAYQEFNVLLNNILTETGCINLISLFKEGIGSDYHRYHEEIKDDFPEAIILIHFDILVEHIYLELAEIVKSKQKQLDSYIEQVIHEVINKDEELSITINYDKACLFIKDKVSDLIDLKSKTARELNNFNLYRADKDILLSQINKTLLEFIDPI